MTRTTVIAVAISAILPATVIGGIAAAGIWFGGGSTPHAFALDGLSPDLQHNYHFAEQQPALMAGIPCYCGCHSLGHGNLLDCYIRPDGGYEQHAAGCGICGMEADDVEQMLTAGQSPEAIRTAIDAEYSSYGKPTNTP